MREGGVGFEGVVQPVWHARHGGVQVTVADVDQRAAVDVQRSAKLAGHRLERDVVAGEGALRPREASHKDGILSRPGRVAGTPADSRTAAERRG
jgi:hypothetical protein